MRSGTGAILLMGFGTLVALIAALAFGAFHRAEQIESKLCRFTKITGARPGAEPDEEDAYKSGVIVRDYLLIRQEGAPQYKQELLAIRSSLPHRLESLTRLISRDEGRVLDASGPNRCLPEFADPF